MDYHLSFNWADIVRKKKSKSDIVQENPVKGKQLYLKISGPVEDLSYGFDKAEIKKERKEIISNEKETIKVDTSNDRSDQGISFNDNDLAINEDNQEEVISAPKTIERLEEISNLRNV